MSAYDEKYSQKVTYNSIIRFVREHEDPAVTATEVAEEFGITNEAANYRLLQIKERGDLVEKRVGSSAKVWYPPELLK